MRKCKNLSISATICSLNPLTGELGAETPEIFRKIGVFGPHFGIESIKIQWHEARVSKIKIVKLQATGTS